MWIVKSGAILGRSYDFWGSNKLVGILSVPHFLLVASIDKVVSSAAGGQNLIAFVDLHSFVISEAAIRPNMFLQLGFQLNLIVVFDVYNTIIMFHRCFWAAHVSVITYHFCANFGGLRPDLRNLLSRGVLGISEVCCSLSHTGKTFMVNFRELGLLVFLNHYFVGVFKGRIFVLNNNIILSIWRLPITEEVVSLLLKFKIFYVSNPLESFDLLIFVAICD